MKKAKTIGNLFEDTPTKVRQPIIIEQKKPEFELSINKEELKIKEDLGILIDKLTKQEVKLNGIDDLILNLKDKYDILIGHSEKTSSEVSKINALPNVSFNEQKKMIQDELKGFRNSFDSYKYNSIITPQIQEPLKVIEKEVPVFLEEAVSCKQPKKVAKKKRTFIKLTSK